MNIKRKIGRKLDESGILSPPFHLPYWKWWRLAILMTLDIIIITLGYWAAFVLRLDEFLLDRYYIQTFVLTLPPLIVLNLVVFYFGGMYRQVWRYANFNSAVLIAKCVFISTVLFGMANFLVLFEQPPPRSVPIIFFLLATTILTAVRFSWRAWCSFQASLHSEDKNRCLIYGAGSVGELFARHIVADTKFPYKAAGFLDDDPNKTGRILHGLRIYGTKSKLEETAKRLNVDTIILAMPSAAGRIVREVVEICQQANLKPLIVPDMANALSKDVVQPRAVDIKDLLRRAPIEDESGRLQRFASEKTILITGAGGSIGSEICRQIFAVKPKRLILLDASEFNLYKIETELRDLNDDYVEIIGILGSVTDEKLIDEVFNTQHPDYVLHAAAYKHVHIVEANPIQGIYNNIYGTKVVAEAAIRYRTKGFLLVSTDKAVRPTSIMGATKRCCELLVQAFHQLHHDRCGFCAVRFGNVLGSSGSVVPRFLEQIKNGGPVTVTHPEVTRYFMVTSEAVSLVLQAAAMSKGGEIFVLNMGEPIKIYDMAKQLIRLQGKEPGKDIEIIFTGLRPGEKLYEELILTGTERHALHGDIFVAIPDHLEPTQIVSRVEKLIEETNLRSSEQMVRTLKTIISWTEEISSVIDHDEIARSKTIESSTFVH